MMKTITTCPGEIIDFETTFVENLALADEAPARVGRCERVDYATSVYEDGVTYNKYCYVYLPYGYDPADKRKKYNVLYYQHGNTCEPEIFVKPENKVLMDNLFAQEGIEPCIIVSTTYYFDIDKDVEERKKTGFVPAGDGGYPGVKPNFTREVVEDIIPAVETRYNTYLTDATPEGIRATRDHRAFSGYSRGAVVTWKMMHDCFEYFRWYAPMSCVTTAGHTIFEEVPEDEVMAYLEAPIKAHPELPFFVYASNGHPNDIGRMTEQMKFVVRGECFSYGKDPAKNNLYFAVSAFSHTDLLVPYYYYNSLQVLFKA